MRSSTAAVDPSMLGSAISHTSGSVFLKFPAKIPPAVKFGGKRLSALVLLLLLLHLEGERFCIWRRPSFLVPSPAFDAVTEQEEIRKVLSKGKAAGLLRLVFHDAGTFEKGDKRGGMNGSIVYELDRPENTGLKKLVKILEKAKGQVDATRPVSWADLTAVAGAEAVLVCRGPKIPVQLGRVDATMPDPEGKLPEESLDAAAMKQCFQRKGFSAKELVALSVAHIIGSKGFGNPTVFDNSYYKILLEKPWLSSGEMSAMIGLPSDRTLVEDEECIRWISKCTDNQNLFFEDFKNVYIKLVNTGAKWKRSL